MRTKPLFFAAVLIAFFSASLSAQIGFKPYSTFVTGSSATALVISDINADGRKDIALVTGKISDNVTDYKLLIYYQNTNGNLNSPVVLYYPARKYNDGAISLDAGDLNGDNKTDIAIASDDSLVIFYQQDATTFNKHCTYIGYSAADAVKIGDLNNDGHADLAVSEFNATSIHIFYQDVNGNLNKTDYPSAECGFVSLEICDINNDLLNDLLLFSYGGYNHGLFYFLQNANGTLDYPYSSGIGQNGGRGMAVGNLNSDSKPDIAVTSGGNYPAKLELHMQQPGTFGFAPPQNLVAYDIPAPVCIDDLDCDGKNEIILAHSGWNAISCFEQDEQHHYSSYKLFFNIYGNYNMYNMATGDLNDDGRPDIALASGHLIIHYNDTKPAVSDTITSRKVMSSQTHNTEIKGRHQFTDTINTVIVRITDSVNVKYTIKTNFGREYRYELRNGLVCNYYVNDTSVIDSVYMSWNDTLSVVQNIYYHHVDTIGVHGIKELLLLGKLKLYPNPTSGMLYFETNSLLKDIQISVFTASGIGVNAPVTKGAGTYRIDLSTKPKGLYFVSFLCEGEIVYKKVIHL